MLFCILRTAAIRPLTVGFLDTLLMLFAYVGDTGLRFRLLDEGDYLHMKLHTGEVLGGVVFVSQGR